ncbi:MAG: hypothetical protein HW373_264, partial [Deltaproteobacteria bacterium]|nr:hypothetical protein [Deltaproteobacteria bacterium]
MEQPNRQRNIIVYGKGGIGKTSVATNLGEALVQEEGRKVMLLGCSPKTSLIDLYDLTGDVVPILDLKRKEGVNAQNIGKAVWRSQEGILLTETGGPEPGIGCAGVGLPTAFGELKKFKGQIADYDKIEYNIYDLIGAGNNILRAVKAVGGDLKVLGYVVNMRGVAREQEIVGAFSEKTNVPVLACIKRDPATFKEAEKRGGPIVRTLPDADVAATFRELARKVEQGSPKTEPRPIDSYDELFDMFLSFQSLDRASGQEGRNAYVARIPAAPVNRDKPVRISIYGTGGIGKSTVSANVSAAMVLMGEKVFQIGCDPKHDSIANLCGGLKPTVLDEIQKRGGARAMNREILKQLIFPGVNHNNHLYGAECGGPVPGKGCAGKGVDLALKLFEDNGLM